MCFELAYGRGRTECTSLNSGIFIMQLKYKLLLLFALVKVL